MSIYHVRILNLSLVLYIFYLDVFDFFPSYEEMWNYIRENSLQDPRKIMYHHILQTLFHLKSIYKFKMNEVLIEHTQRLDVANDTFMILSMCSFIWIILICL